MQAPAQPAASTTSAARPFVPATTIASAWELVVSVDPSIDTEPDPASPCPLDRPDVVISVDRDELLVGRHDDRRDIHPEVALHDPGASRRHAKFARNADGSIALVDLASTNGTRLNGEDVPAGGRKPLKAGDAVLIGRWTRITLRARP
jgi:pSer/pThr/pTyr-binding forkhead associated (FHA) protein